MLNERNWLSIRFYREGYSTVFAEQKMLTVPEFGSYIKFPDEISQVNFQIIDYPKHVIGLSKNRLPYHYISVTIKEFVLDQLEE